MKKLIVIGAVLMGLSGIAYASGYGKSCDTHRFTHNLNLDAERAEQVDALLGEYKQVKTLAMKGEFDKIPAFIESKNAELALVLTEEEMTLFKENIGEWAGGKDFSKWKMKGNKPWAKHH